MILMLFLCDFHLVTYSVNYKHIDILYFVCTFTLVNASIVKSLISIDRYIKFDIRLFLQNVTGHVRLHSAVHLVHQ